MKIQLINYDYSKYIEILKTYSCFRGSKNYDYFSKTNKKSNELMKELIFLSKKRCYICGAPLEQNTKKGMYFEREHIISQAIIEESTIKCKRNLIPICKTCNLLKTTVEKNSVLEENLLNTHRKCLANKHEDFCEFNLALDEFKKINFDYNIVAKNYKKSLNVEFDILAKTFIGNQEFIDKFDLNNRTDLLFLSVMTILYNTDFIGYKNLKEEVLNLHTKFSIDESFIEYLDNINLLKCNSNEISKKRDNFFELITSLEMI